MNENEMVKLNNRRRKQLTEENKAYYEDMLLYLRKSRLPAKKVEELLLEILDHLLVAQTEGRTATEVFGTEPEAYCEELVQSFEKPPYFYLKRYVFIFGIGLSVGFLLDGVFRYINLAIGLPDRGGDTFYLLLFPFLAVPVVEIIFAFFRKSTFKKRRTKRMLWSYILPMVFLWVLPFGGTLWLRMNYGEVLDRYAAPLAPWMSLLIGVALWGLHRIVFRNADWY